MTQITIPTGEHGTTRVFSLSMPAAEARALKDDPERQKTLLGAQDIDPQGIEVFAVEDLGGIGLAGYLREGADVPEADLARDRARLAALDGWVMLVHSLALPDTGTTLDPDPSLTLIGTYRQADAETSRVDLEAAAAQPYTGTANPASPAVVRSSSGSAVIAVVAVLALLVLWWILS